MRALTVRDYDSDSTVRGEASVRGDPPDRTSTDRLLLAGIAVMSTQGSGQSAVLDLPRGRQPEPALAHAASPVVESPQSRASEFRSVTNLFTNPTSENDSNGWVPDAGLTMQRLNTGSPPYGTWAHKIQGGAALTQGIRFMNQDGSRMVAIPRATYNVRVFLRNDAASVGVVAGHIGIRFFDAGGTLLNQNNTTWHGPVISYPVGGAWEEHTWQVVAYNEAVTMRPDFEETAGWSAGRFMWFANIMVWAGDYDPGYIDGQQPQCYWTGTPHASTSRRDGQPYLIGSAKGAEPL